MGPELKAGKHEMNLRKMYMGEETGAKELLQT
jgi:hypothetical protein